VRKEVNDEPQDFLDTPVGNDVRDLVRFHSVRFRFLVVGFGDIWAFSIRA